MTMSHIPENTAEKVFILIFTFITYDLHEYFAILFNRIIDKYIGNSLGKHHRNLR